MAKYLVIVESPAKAKTIEKFLGRNYKVMASIGHIRDLPKSKMGVDIENDFEPQYISIRGKGPVIKELRKVAKKSDKVFLATDPDREGEAIAWHLQFLLGLDAEEKNRVTFHEITKTAIKAAIKEPRVVNQDLVDAQQARRILDRLVGYSISPILWRKIRKGLSAGRVQSVATKMICDKEEEINAFVPEEYWNIDVDVEGDARRKFEIALASKNNEKIKVTDGETSDSIVKELHAGTYKIVDLDSKIKKRKPYAPFTTSTLQQEAANRYGFSTKKTMMLAQQLYEGIAIKGQGTVGLITYMRTDSTRISDEAKSALREYLLETLGERYLSNGDAKAKKVKSAQDAHEAIRPTVVTNTPVAIEAALSKDQLKLYKLIWERFAASQMAPAEFNATSVVVENGPYQLKTNGSTMVFDGFLKVYSFTSSKDKILPDLSVGEILTEIEIKQEQKFTQPPARYTEASLVKAMEELGIGRPSTYAPTISTIISRGYVEREKKNLLPTELGFIINDIMANYFNSIVNVDFTAEIESEFDKIETGNMVWKDTIRDFYGPFKKVLDHAEVEIEKVDLSEETDIECEKCGSMMLIKHGKFGKFMACSNYPECKNTKPILKEIGIKCPLCEEGQIVERKTKKFKNFYGCSTFPDCRFVSWDKPIDRFCPTCDSILVEKKTKRIHEIRCSNQECDYKEKIEASKEA